MKQKTASEPAANRPEPRVTAKNPSIIPVLVEGMLPSVGLGGSEGGIRALKEFFAAMPVDSGMAFVVILHISPQHSSTLAEMLPLSTVMPVTVAKQGATVQANSVCVIPPGNFLASANGHLRLTEAQEPRRNRVAVDYFFRTLAETHGAQCLAVVFSGAGGDGALGLKRIKELGGLTVAQDPDDAEYSDMARSAITMGVTKLPLQIQVFATDLDEDAILEARGLPDLLIYLVREAQQRAFDIFRYALRSGGCLFLGTSEKVEDGSPLFAVIHKKQRLCLHRPDADPRRALGRLAQPGVFLFHLCGGGGSPARGIFRHRAGRQTGISRKAASSSTPEAIPAILQY